MSNRAVLIGSLVEPLDGPALAERAAEVDILEVRADLLGDVATERLAQGSRGRRLYTLRSEAEGGRGPNGGHERQDRLLAAAERFDLVDLEAERDLSPEVLDRVAPERRVISWHGAARPREALGQKAAAMLGEPAWLYKLVVSARRAGQGIEPLELLRELDRRDVVAFAAGGATSWTRLLAPRLGASVVYGALTRAAAPGQVTIARLRRDFDLPDLRPARHLCGVVGEAARHSLSPRLHNAIYRALDLDYLYLPFEVPVFGDFWLDVVEGGGLEELGFPLVGLSVTSPFKEVALAVAGASSPLADRIGSANTLVHNGSVWEGESTDPAGVAGPLSAHGVGVEGRRAAVLGAGGASRAAVFALGSAGAEVTLVNRSRERGQRVARELGVAYLELESFDPGGYGVIVNATPLGSAATAGVPFDPAAADSECVVVDLAYLEDRPTDLVVAIRERGGLAIDGREALLHQALPQFRMMTGGAMPPDMARRALGLEAAGAGA